MKRILMVLAVLVVGLSFAAPAATDASLYALAPKKKEEKKKKKAPEVPKSLKGPAGPAKLSAPKLEGKELEREALADKKRDEQIESLKKIIGGGKVTGAAKAELLFQLAELWWEKSKFIFGTEMQAYDKAYAEYMEKKNKGEKVEAEEPKLVTRQSELYRKEAVRIYVELLKDYANYERRDEVIFTVAFNLYEMGQKKEAVGHYATLIKQYPKSRYIADAYVQMGNHFFDENDLSRARRAFEKAIELNNMRVYSYAMYKLAWCDFNGGDYEGALTKFKTVVDLSDKAASGAPAQRDRIQLKTEALKDMILTFLQMDAVDEGMDYYKSKASDALARDLSKKLVNVFYDSGKNEGAIRGYQRLIAEGENDPECPVFQSNIIKSWAALQRRDKIRPEMEILVEKYKPTGAWAKINEKNKGALATAYEITESALYELVTDFHKEAINTKSIDTYVLARDIYKKYVDNFPEASRAYEMRYLYADILWAIEDFDNAAIQYELVRDADAAGVRMQKAAYNTVLSYEKLVAIAKGELEKRDIEDLKQQKIDEKKKKAEAKRKQILAVATKDQKEEPIPEIELKLVAACDKYVQLVTNDEKNEIILRYKGAFTYYDHFHYVEAGDRFGFIINKWPTDQWAQKAADLILDSLNIKEEWASLNKLARSFFGNKKLATGEFATRVHGLIEGSQFKLVLGMNEEKKYAEAAVGFREFVKEFPKSGFADKALYNAMVIFDRAEQLDIGIDVGEQLLKEYDKSDKQSGKNADAENLTIVKLTVATIGSFYERISDFDTAIKYYLQYVARWEKDEKAADMLFNAALWQEGLGNNDKAIELYERYMKAYKEKKDIPDIFFSIALMLERQGKIFPAAIKLEEYLKTYKNEPEWKRYHAKYKLAMQLRLVKREADSDKLLGELLDKDYKKLSKEEKDRFVIKDAAAHARFLLHEPAFQEFLAFKFVNVRTLKGDLPKKKKATLEEAKFYADVIAYGSPGWSLASLTRIGQAYKDLKETILKAPEPKGLDPEQLDMYRSELESRAFEFEETSIEAFEKAIEKSVELGFYNEWTITAQEELLKFKKDAFGEIKELPYFGSEFFFAAGPEAEPMALHPTAPSEPAHPEPGSPPGDPSRRAPAPAVPGQPVAPPAGAGGGL